jgi:hypothetical protein
VAGERWRYVVRAVDAHGRPIAGSARLQVVVGGHVVDTVGLFGFKGRLRRTYRWSEQLAGEKASLRARIVGPGGTKTAAYAVRVRSGSTAGVTGHPQFRASVRGQNRQPVAGAKWRFLVRAVGTKGAGFSGTAIVRVVVHRRIVDVVGWFGFKGTLRRTYRFSPRLRGDAAIFQAKVVGNGGTRTVGYAVRVR